MIHTNICWILFYCEKRCEKSKFSMAESKSRFFQWNWLFSSVHTYVYNNGRLWIKKAYDSHAVVARLLPIQHQAVWCVLGKTVCYLFRWFWCRVIVQYTRTIRWYTWRRAYQHSSMNKQDGWMHSTPTQWQPLSLFNQYIRMGRKMSLWFWQWCTHEPIFTLILFITVVFLSGLSLLLMCFFLLSPIFLQWLLFITACHESKKKEFTLGLLFLFAVHL